MGEKDFYLVSRNMGKLGSNLKIIVLRNEFEWNYLSILDRTFKKQFGVSFPIFFWFFSKVKTKMDTRGLTWKKV